MDSLLVSLQERLTHWKGMYGEIQALLQSERLKNQKLRAENDRLKELISDK